jgi:ABC-type transport system involved in multi-copper enzyme maturation permease subunit
MMELFEVMVQSWCFDHRTVEAGAREGDFVLFVGPVFTREVVTVPRRTRLYVSRAAYVAALAVLLGTAWQVLTGTQLVRNLGDLARFSALVFQILATLQLVVTAFFAATSAAIAVSQEKDRHTLVLLLTTSLSNAELVLGRLLASLLGVLTLVAAAFPLFVFLTLLGGVSLGQLLRSLGVTVASIIMCGSLGSTIALWREKTFQTLAMTSLALFFWTAGWELLAWDVLALEPTGVAWDSWAVAFSPWHAMLEAVRPLPEPGPALGWFGDSVPVFFVSAAAFAILLNGLAIFRVRAWNTSSEARSSRRSTLADYARDEVPSLARTTQSIPPQRPLAADQPTRHVWDNPILWREIRTWAYGRRIVIIRLVYALLFALAAFALRSLDEAHAVLSRLDVALPLVPLLVLSLMLVNAQAVTSLTSERDARAIDLLLVTDLTPKEFVFGKLAGIIYNTKEMILLPAMLCGYLWYLRAVNLEDLAYLLGGWLVMNAFAAMLGVHAGMTYSHSRVAISVSLGTLFFLFIGVATSMRIMVAFSGSFTAQFQSFWASIVGGGIGLYVALGMRNPSPAIALAAFLCPLATFYALTSFLLDHTLAVFLVVSLTYGFTTAAMLIPAIFEFDVATGRTGNDES